MPLIRREESIAAGATANLARDSLYEFAQFDSALDLGVVGSAAGLVVTVTTGSDVLVEESPVPVLATFPKIPDDMDVQDVMTAGEKLTVSVRNTTAGALTARMLARIQFV